MLNRGSFAICTLDTIADFRNGKSLSPSKYSPDGQYPVYGANGQIARTNELLNASPVVVIGRVGACGSVYFVKEPSWVTDNAIVATPKPGIDVRFLYFLLKSLGLNQTAIGSAQPLMTQGGLKAVITKTPPLSEQRAIAHILGTLDDKIELNRRMNQTLDAMAQALFKSWFVDFEPFRDQGMQDSPLGEIPVGWRVGKLSELCTTQYGYTASAIEEPVGPHLLRVMDINKQNWIEWDKVPYCEITDEELAKYRLEVGDVVVARMADPGKSAIVEQDVQAVFASYLVRLKTDSLAHAYFVYGFLKSQAYADYSEGAMGGSSVQKSMNAKVIVDVDLVIPPQQVLELFLQYVVSIRKHLAANVEQTATLTSIRDALLPKLVSGEIRVKDAERFVEEADSLTQKQDEAIYTIGHSNHSMEDFIRLLKKHSITAVADVRSAPVSKHNPQFNKDMLSAALRKQNIAYAFMGKELGGRPDDTSLYDNGRVNYLKMVEKPLFKEGINRLLKGRKQHRIVLLCAEKEPLDCHRTILISRHLYRMGIPVKHILANSQIEDHHDTEQRMVRSLGIGKGLFDYTLPETERIEKAYSEQARKMAYRLHQRGYDSEHSE